MLTRCKTRLTAELNGHCINNRRRCSQHVATFGAITTSSLDPGGSIDVILIVAEIHQIVLYKWIRNSGAYSEPMTSHAQSRRKDPPHPPVGGASRMLRGLMLRRRAVLGTPKCEKSAPPRTPLGELTALPRPPSWWGRAQRSFAAPSPRTPLTILSIGYCMYTRI